MLEHDAWVLPLLKDERIKRDFEHPNEYELVPYLVADGQKHPVALICPGGGYGMVCSYVEGEPFAKELNARGYHALVLYYRIRERARYPGPQEDLARAIREMHSRAEEWKLDVLGYSVWGSSAGGHLVASMGTERMGYGHYGLPKPGALVLTYPVVTMGLLTHTGTRENLLGSAPGQDIISMTSVERQVTEQYPPTFLWSGDSDSCVSPENSRMLYRALQERNIPCQYEEYPGIDHGVGLGTGMVCEDWFDKAVAFWLEQRAQVYTEK